MSDSAKRRLNAGVILAILFGALLGGYAIAEAILEVAPDHEEVTSTSEPITVGEIEVSVRGKTLRLRGRAPDSKVVQEVIDLLLAATPADAAVDRVEIDPGAAPPSDVEHAAAEIRARMQPS